MGNPRDYGLPDTLDAGVPKIVETLNHECPNCKCAVTYRIEVAVKNKLLRGGQGIGTYVGCAACPWASPMMSRATPSQGNG